MALKNSRSHQADNNTAYNDQNQLDTLIINRY